MVKVVINAIFGGYGLSEEAIQWLLENGSPETVETVKADGDNAFVCHRHNPDLVRCVEAIGSERASGECAKLEVSCIEGNQYVIREYDGYESVETPGSIHWITVQGA